MDDDIRKLLGLRIKTVRRQRNLTQERLCSLADIDESTLCRIENGKRLPSLDKFISILKVLKTNPCEMLNFINFETEQREANPKDILLYETIAVLDEKSKEKIFTFIKMIK